MTSRVAHDAEWDAHMGEAIGLATSPDAPHGQNPRVGCVVVGVDGSVVGRGYHRGAGTPHAEVVALAEAGSRATGGTAIVTLEPCRHTGRTGPCTQALLAAGVRRVVFGQADPTAQAGGGAAELAAAGVEVVGGVRADAAAAINAEWTFAVSHARPFVTWKVAVSLDGRVAGPGGRPVRLTGDAANRAVHELRARVGAIIVGTGTVLADDPALTVRLPTPPVGPSPIRVVVGTRTVPRTARVLDDAAPTVLAAQRDPRAVLVDLYEHGVRHALLEGGPTLAAAFCAAGVVDRVEVYVAPMLLGSGPGMVPARTTPRDLVVSQVDMVGEDVRIIGRLRTVDDAMADEHRRDP